MADWFIATEGVKVVKDSASLWPQIITAVSSIGAALGGVGLIHHFTRRREEIAAATRRDSERLFIATELVFILEQFAEGCAGVQVWPPIVVTKTGMGSQYRKWLSRFWITSAFPETGVYCRQN